MTISQTVITQINKVKFSLTVLKLKKNVAKNFENKDDYTLQKRIYVNVKKNYK